MSQTVELLRSAARDFDNGGDNILWKGPALRELASQLSELTPERVRTVQRILAAEHYNEADEERKAFSATSHKGVFAACPHPRCIENKAVAAVLRALAALAGSTNG